MGGISIWQLVIIAVIVVLLFGTKKLRGIGGDLGGAVKGFKKAMSDEDKPVAKNEDKIESPKQDASFNSESNTEKSKEKDQA